MNSQPFKLPGQFFKGNLHTHCTESDGDYSVEEVVKRYRQQGYDILTMSDHFHERFGYPITDTRPYRSNGFTTLIATELHVGKTLNDALGDEAITVNSNGGLLSIVSRVSDKKSGDLGHPIQ